MTVPIRLAVAGTMAVAVPPLTAAFLFAGKHAIGANLMAQRLSSGNDTFKEEKTSPDSVHAGAMVDMPSPYTHSPSAGYTTMTGASNLTPSYSWGDSHQLAITSAEGRSQAISSSFAASAGRRIVAAAGSHEGGITGGVFNSHEAASSAMSWAAAKDWSAGFSSGTEGSAASSDQIRTDLAYGIAAGVPLKQVIGIGLAQCLAMVPGVSRSGATIMGALAMGVNRKTAAEFSFFLAVPTMIGATTLELATKHEELTTGSGTVGWWEILVGFVVSFVVALVVIRAFVAYVSRRGFAPFAWYRIVIGAFAIWWFAFR